MKKQKQNNNLYAYVSIISYEGRINRLLEHPIFMLKKKNWSLCKLLNIKDSLLSFYYDKNLFDSLYFQAMRPHFYWGQNIGLIFTVVWNKCFL